MKLIHTHAVNALLEKADSFEPDERRSWRCIYMRLQDRQERLNRQLRTHFINRAIVDILSRDEGHIYFCDDGDIFILFDGALKPIAEKLSLHFGDLNPDQLRGNAESGMFIFFDFSKHWQGFYSLCRQKAQRAATSRDRLPPTPLPADAHMPIPQAPVIINA